MLLQLDDVCFGKTRDEAMTPASLDNPNFGVGDGALITDGVLKSSNCDCKGYSRPALLQLAGNHSTIDVLTRGAPVDPIAIPNAIAAGPNLVSWNASTGTASVNIPEVIVGHSYRLMTFFLVMQCRLVMLFSSSTSCPGL